MMLKVRNLVWLVVLATSMPSVNYAKTRQTRRLLSLEDVRSLVGKNNHSLRLAKENLYQTSLLIDHAWSMFKPQWNAVGSYTRNSVAAAIEMPQFESLSSDPAVCNGTPLCFTDFDRTQIQKKDTFAFASTLSVPVFVPRALAIIQEAYTGYDLAKLNTKNLEDYLEHSAEVAFFGALTTQKLVDIANKSIQIRQEHLRIAQARHKAGDEPRISVVRAQIEVNRAQQDVRSAQNAQALAQEALGRLIGLKPIPPFRLQNPKPPQTPTKSLKAYIDQALQQRRDLGAARFALRMGELKKKEAWYRFLPAVLANGALRISDTKGFFDEHFTWNVGLAISVPLYDGGLRTNYLNQAESEIRQAQIKIEETQYAIRQEIRQHWHKMEMAAANLKKAKESLDLAGEQARLAKIAYQQGAGSNLELLDANSLYTITGISVAQEELDLQLAMLRLERSIKMFVPSESKANQ